jgi:hypothetical protein
MVEMSPIASERAQGLTFVADAAQTAGAGLRWAFRLEGLVAPRRLPHRANLFQHVKKLIGCYRVIARFGWPEGKAVRST